MAGVFGDTKHKGRHEVHQGRAIAEEKSGRASLRSGFKIFLRQSGYCIDELKSKYNQKRLDKKKAQQAGYRLRSKTYLAILSYC
jgi:hypothetical protein